MSAKKQSKSTSLRGGPPQKITLTEVECTEIDSEKIALKRDSKLKETKNMEPKVKAVEKTDQNLKKSETKNQNKEETNKNMEPKVKAVEKTDQNLKKSETKKQNKEETNKNNEKEEEYSKVYSRLLRAQQLKESSPDQWVDKVKGIVSEALQAKDHEMLMDGVEDLQFTYQVFRKGKDLMALLDIYSDAGYVKLFNKVMEEITSKKLDLDLDENEFVLNLTDSLCSLLLNASDGSLKVCQSILDTKTDSLLCKILENVPLQKKSHNNTKRVDDLLSIVFNCLHHLDAAKQAFRDEGAVNIMQKWRNSSELMLETLANINLAYLINEEENDLINADAKTLIHMIKLLEEALQKTNRVSHKSGFSAEEILEALNKLALHDGNKEKIIQNGALSSYVKMMGSNCREKEQLNAVKGLWILAFNDKNKEMIKKNQLCMKTLKNLAKSSSYPAVKKGADGALWVIEKKDEEETLKRAKSAKKRGIEETPHVMISYNWGSKATMIKVRDRLKAAGYKIWMDVDDMSGNTLEAMAKAVEEACVVLVCFSVKYKESPSCRTEAEYTYKLGKDIIPLRLQYKYNADGWLGIFLGTKLWYDLSLEEKFESSMKALIGCLGNRGKIDAKQIKGPAPIIPTHEHLTQSILVPSVDSGAVTWKEKQVENWLKKSDLQKYTKRFSTYDGSMLMELKKMYKNAPEFFYSSLEKKFGFQFDEILKLTKALDCL